MKFLEYGDINNPAILLVHGMGGDGEYSFRSSIELLQDKYRIIVPMLDGFDGGRTTFDTIYSQAEKISKFVGENYGGKLYAALGMSLGGFICIDLFTRFNLTVKKLILDGGYVRNWVFPHFCAYVASVGFRKLKQGCTWSILRFAMKKSMGYCFKSEDLCSPTRKTVYNSELGCFTYKLPDNLKSISAEQIVYWYGLKEKHMINGMKKLKKLLPQMRTLCTGNYGHGEVMYEHPQTYARNLADELAFNSL